MSTVTNHVQIGIGLARLAELFRLSPSGQSRHGMRKQLLVDRW